MTYIILGAISFFLAFLFDLARLRQHGWLKPLLWLLVMVTGLAAHVMVALQGPWFTVPAPLNLFGWAILIAGVAGTVYSLFVEIPLMQTYVLNGQSGGLLTSGTYALVRHPGVLWYAVVLLGLVLASQSWLALAAAPIWLAADILHVWYQDRVILVKLFPEYDVYRQSTPFLIPSRRSLLSFRQSLRVREQRSQP